MNYSELKNQTETHTRRSIFLLIAKLGIFSLVGWRLFNIQILESKKYKTLSKKNQINVEILYPIRGEIKDRNNVVIASNIKTYNLYLIPEQCPDINKTLNNLNNYVKIDFTMRRKIIELSKKVKKFEKIKIINNIDWKNLEFIEANKIHLPGLHLLTFSKRIYPFSNYFSHILGYVNKPSEDELNLPFISNMPSLNIGKTGMEKFFNQDLIGIAGKREIEVNALGREIREISTHPSQKGKVVNISVDFRVQQFAHKELNNYKAGSIVVIDVNSGEIITMVSKPDYDPNLIITKPNKDYWNSILNNTLSPLTNRSIQGLYSPGSTFKMIVALAGLQKGVIDFNETEFCEGKIEYGDRYYHCWKELGHGKINIEKAIIESCDVFFYELSKKVGIDNISKMAKKLGLAKKYDFGFDNEKIGIVPSKKWKKENLKENWYAGETLNAGIGQGYVLATPLQLALMTARIATNGRKIEPTIIKQNEKKIFKKIDIKENNLTIIKNAMYKVVNEQKGTAFKSRSGLYNFSGKTGTSQVKRITIEERESENFKKKKLDWKDKDHALFVGYMPSEKPKYAISVVIEHGGSGAAIAAPIAKKIFDHLHDLTIS